jgi:hypothetical protein
MRFKINFNHALAISLLWHLLCFFGITIIIVPAGIRDKRLPDVYFLGALLDENTFGYGFRISEGFSKRETSVFSEASLVGSEESPGPMKIKDRDYIVKKGPHIAGSGPIINTEKIIPDIRDKGAYRESVVLISQEGPEAGRRKALLKPPLPERAYEMMEELNKDSTASYNVRIEVLIGDNGTVQSTRILKASGYPDMDIIMADHIKKWRFSELDYSETGKDMKAVFIIETPD